MDATILFLIFVALLLLVMLVAFSGLLLLWIKSIPLSRRGLKPRQQLLYNTVRQYRLSKMLSFIGVRLDDYIMRIPEYQIKKHIVRCRNCPNISTCDRCLHDGMHMSDMHFCPNYKSLMYYSKVMPAVE